MPDKNDGDEAKHYSHARGESDTTESSAHRKKGKKRTGGTKGNYWPSPLTTRRITLVTEAGLLVVGVAYSFFAYQQWRATTDAVKAARESVIQTKQSAHLDQRAWVAIAEPGITGKAEVGQALYYQNYD